MLIYLTSLLLIIIGYSYKIDFLWQIGVVTILFELTINYYKDRILYQQIEKVLRRILGIEDSTTKFYPSIVNLIYHKDFNITRRVIKNRLIKTKRQRHNNLGLISEEIVELIPQRENIHYVFFRGSAETESPTVLKIKCKGENFTEIIDPNSDKELIKTYDGSNICFTVRKKLEKNKKSTLQITNPIHNINQFLML